MQQFKFFQKSVPSMRYGYRQSSVADISTCMWQDKVTVHSCKQWWYDMLECWPTGISRSAMCTACGQVISCKPAYRVCSQPSQWLVTLTEHKSHGHVDWGQAPESSRKTCKNGLQKLRHESESFNLTHFKIISHILFKSTSHSHSIEPYFSSQFHNWQLEDNGLGKF